MILILSNSHDVDTNGVIDWLNYYKLQYFRLNDQELFIGKTKFYYSLDDNTGYFISAEQKKITLNEIKVVWFRKFGFLHEHDIVFNNLDPSSNLLKYCYSEFNMLRKLLFKILENKEWFYYKGLKPTKIEVLILAKKIGLNIPKTIITNKKDYITNEFRFNKTGLITKPMGEGKQINFKNTNTPLLTTMFYIKDINSLNLNVFCPSKIQENIQKLYELRIFFVGKKLYPMAIFSQQNSSSKVDSRNINNKKPSRRVPYKLSKKIILKLKSLISNLDIDSGSIDMIKSSTGEYVFLEVNPTGQFGMTSVPCNYPLHKKVALHLKKKVKHEYN